MDMRLVMKSRYGLVAVALAVAGGAFASTETDWSQLSGAVTIPAGETWYADESDMATVNGLTSITVNGAVTGDNPVDAATLIFRDTTTPPKAGLLLGAGNVRKSGMSVWRAYANSQTGFTGDWHLDGGVVTNTAVGAFGAYATTGVGKLYVHDGAALVVNNKDTEFWYRDLHIAGAGNLLVPRALALPKIMTGGVRRLYLDDDATIETGSDHYWLSDQGQPRNTKNGELDLGDHTLTQYGKSLEWYFLGATIRGIGGIVFKGKGVVYRTGSWGGTEAGSAPFTFGAPGGGTMNFTWYNRPPAIRRDFQINVPVTVAFTFNQESAKSNLMSTNYNHWTGDVALNGTASRLKLATEIHGAFTVSGTVSGEGSVQIGNMGSYDRNLLKLFGRNTYSGSTVVTEKGLNGIMAAWPDSIPDYSKTFVTNGYVAARFGLAADGTTPRWTATDLWGMMNGVNFYKEGHVSIDAEECENATYEMSVADIAANVPDPDRRRIGVAGGTLKLRVNAGDEQRIGLATDRGTLELVGGGTFHLAPTNDLKGIVPLSNYDSAPVAELRVTDGSTVVQSNEYVSVGGANYFGVFATHGMARLVVSNGTWRTEYDVAETNDTTGSGVPALGRGAIWVGRQNRGILEVQKGGVVSNKVVVGGGNSYSYGYGLGAIFLSEGGKLYICKKGDKGHLASSIGSGCYGYLQQTGGELDASSLVLGGYSVGIAHVYGGTAQFPNHLEIAGFNGGNGRLYITNGVWKTTNSGGDGYLRLCYGGNGGEAYVTLDGPEAQLLLNGNSGNIYGANTAKYIERFNVNHGGTLQFGYFTLYNVALLNKAAYPYPCVLNVNGGIIKRRNGWSAHNMMFGENATNRFARIVVYEEGMTVDTNGKEETVQIAEMPFEGADGNGIMRIDLGGEERNLIGAPRVEVENVGDGAGYGATAVADWDPATRVLKGVHITSHGWGYTQGKVKVTLSIGSTHWSKTLTDDAITVGANVAGGFTKRGAGTLTLNATNTWAQWTKVEGGTLRANADWAIPAGTAVTLSGGGVLDFNSTTGEVASVTYGVGGGSIVNAENVVLPQALTFALDVEDLLAGRSIPMTGNINLEGVEIRLTGDLNRLDPEVCRRHTLLAVSDGTASGTPVLVGSEVPMGWVLAVTGEGVRLVRPCGFTLTVR